MAQERFFARVHTLPDGVRVFQMDSAAEPIYLGTSDRPQLELNTQIEGPIRLAFEYDSPLPMRASLDGWLGPACPQASFAPSSESVRGGWTVKQLPSPEMGPFRLPLGRVDRTIQGIFEGRWWLLGLLGLLGLARGLRRDKIQLVVQCEPSGAELTSQDLAVSRDRRGRTWIDRGRAGDEVVVRLSAPGYEAHRLSIPGHCLTSLRSGGSLLWPPAGPIRLQLQQTDLPPWELSQGETVAGYRVAERLGEGVSAVVYRVTPLHDEQAPALALKLLKPEEMRGTQVIPRFRREMAAMVRMKHPNIPYLLDYGEYRGMPYLCMELLQGRSLAEQSLPLDARRSREVLLSLTRALSYAHQLGLLHRDVKPGNVVLSDDGVVKLTDFGLARWDDAATLTLEGTLLGTPAYMAPETISGQPASPQSDHYSLACLALEIMTGKPPYAGESPLAVAIQQVQEPPPNVSALVPELDSALAQWLQQMLCKAPEERPPNLEGLLWALESMA